MTKTQQLHNLVYQLRRNYPTDVTTFGPCSEGCGNSARGSGMCAKCCENKITELTGDTALSSVLHDVIRIEHNCINELIEAIDDD